MDRRQMFFDHFHDLLFSQGRSRSLPATVSRTKRRSRGASTMDLRPVPVSFDRSTRRNRIQRSEKRHFAFGRKRRTPNGQLRRCAFTGLRAVERDFLVIRRNQIEMEKSICSPSPRWPETWPPLLLPPPRRRRRHRPWLCKDSILRLLSVSKSNKLFWVILWFREDYRVTNY